MRLEYIGEFVSDSYRSDLLKNLENDILRSIEVTPLEDGFIHPSQKIIFDFMKKYPIRLIKDWTHTVFSAEYKHFNIAIAVLKLISYYGSAYRLLDGDFICETALKNENLEVREASILTIESAGKKEFIEKLKNYSEPITYLDSYRKKVIEQLEKVA